MKRRIEREEDEGCSAAGREWEWSETASCRRERGEAGGSTGPWPQGKCATDAQGVCACVSYRLFSGTPWQHQFICTSYLWHLDSWLRSLKTFTFLVKRRKNLHACTHTHTQIGHTYTCTRFYIHINIPLFQLEIRIFFWNTIKSCYESWIQTTLPKVFLVI